MYTCSYGYNLNFDLFSFYILNLDKTRGDANSLTSTPPHACRAQLDASNAIGIYRFASDHNCLLLKKAASSFICANFVHVSSEEEFADIPKDILLHFLSSEHLHVDSEYQVGALTIKTLMYICTSSFLQKSTSR
jgi:hypothetical protein